MIKINSSEKQFILDLNKFPYDEHSFNVISKGENGNELPWGVEMVSSDFISATRGADNTFNINVDIENLKDEAFILIRNYKKERVKVIVKPNMLLTAPKTYKFRISKKSTDGKKTRIRIISKENNNEIGWTCTYDGKPLNYSITPMESDKSGYVDIEPLDELFTNVSTVIEFTQDKSGEVIRLELNQDNDVATILKAD